MVHGRGGATGPRAAARIHPAGRGAAPIDVEAVQRGGHARRSAATYSAADHHRRVRLGGHLCRLGGCVQQHIAAVLASTQRQTLWRQGSLVGAVQGHLGRIQRGGHQTRSAGRTIGQQLEMLLLLLLGNGGHCGGSATGNRLRYRRLLNGLDWIGGGRKRGQYAVGGLLLLLQLARRLLLLLLLRLAGGFGRMIAGAAD